MPANYALYTTKYDRLPQENMRQLADDVTPEIGMTDRGLTFIYQWPDLKLIVAEMASDQVSEHLRGFEAYIRIGIYRGATSQRGDEIIDQIRRTKMVVGVEAQPDIDERGRCEELLGRMCGGLRPIMFHRDAIYDFMGRLLLGPDQSFDASAEVEGPLPP